MQDGRYWSYVCTNPGCCPADGVPFDTGTHPASALLTGLSGRQVLASRETYCRRYAEVAARNVAIVQALADEYAERFGRPRIMAA